MPSSPLVSRRTVARGVAWSVPVVAVSVAAPAFAVSPAQAPPVASVSVCQCQGQNTKKYQLTLTFSTTSTHTFSISNVSIVESGKAVGMLTTSSSVAAPPSARTASVNFTRGSNGSTDSYTVQYTLKDDTADFTYAATSYTTPGAISTTVSCASCV